MCSSDFLTSSSPPLEIRRTSSTRSSNVIPLHIFQSETAVSLTRYASPLPFMRSGVPSQSLPTTPLRRISLLLTLSLFNNIRHHRAAALMHQLLIWHCYNSVAKIASKYLQRRNQLTSHLFFNRELHICHENNIKE